MKAGNEVRSLGSLLFLSHFIDGQKSTDRTIDVKWWQYSINCLLIEAPNKNLGGVKSS